MSEFSELLGDILQDRNLSIVDMARYCVCERSTMYKIVKGTRMPASLSLVYTIAEYLRLSPEEREYFVDTYRMTVVGKDVYYRRKAVQDFLSEPLIPHMDAIPEQHHGNPEIERTEEIPAVKPLTTLRDVSYAINHQLLKETARGEKAEIYIISTDRNESIHNVLEYAMRENPMMNVHHLASLRGSNYSSDIGKDYNFRILKGMLVLTAVSDQYDPYYVYNSHAGLEDPLIALSNVIVTTSAAVLYSRDTGHGILFNTKEMCEFYRDFFRNVQLQARPAFRTSSNVMAHIRKLNQELPEEKEKTIVYSMKAQMIFFLPQEIVEKNRAEGKVTEQEYQDLLRYISNGLNGLKKHSAVMITSLAGINLFMDHGEYALMPENCIREMRLSERVEVLRRLFLTLDHMNLVVLRRPLGTVNQDMTVEISWTMTRIRFAAWNRSITYADVTEPGICEAFMDYLQSIQKDPEMVFSREELKEVLSGMIQDYERKLQEQGEE